jgi:hypothetical protein
MGDGPGFAWRPWGLVPRPDGVARPHGCRAPGAAQKRTVHPPSRPVPGALPPYRDSCSVLPRRLKVAA